MREIQTIEIGPGFLYNGIKEKRSVDMGKKVGIIVGVLVLLLAAAGGIYYYMTNTPKNKYLLGEKQSIESWNGYLSDRYENELELQNMMVEEPYRSSVTVSAEASETLLSSVGVPASVVDSTSITLNVGHDEKGQQSEVSLVPTFAGTDIDKFEWSADKDTQYISAPLFDEKLMVKNKDIKQVYERIVGEALPEDFDVNMLNLNKLMESNFTQQEIEDMQWRYLEVVMDSLEDEQFKKDSESTDVFGDKEKLDTVTMTLENADIQRVIKNVGAELKKDEEIKKWYNSSFTTYTAETYEESIDNLLKEAKDEDFGTIVAKNFMDGKTIVKRDITWTPAENDDNADDTVRVMTTEKIDKDVQFEAVFTDEAAKDGVRLDGTSKGTDTIKDEYKLSTFGDDEPFSVTFTNDEKVDGNKRTNDMNVVIDDGTEDTYNLSYNNDMNTDLKNNKQTSRGTLTVNVEGEDIKLNFDTTTKVKEKLNVKADGAVDLKTLSDEDLAKLQESIMTNVETLMGQIGAANGF